MRLIWSSYLENTLIITRAVCEVILVPPEAPVINLTSPDSSFMTSSGQVEDKGLFPGLMKLFGEGGTSNPLVILGLLKSSISLLNKIPVCGDMTTDPKLHTYKVKKT